MNVKKNKIFALTLLTTLLVFAVFAVSVNAQSTATVIVADSVGGTTDPAAGTTTPDDGTDITFTATSADGFVFSNWVVSTDAGSNTIDTPSFDITVVGGVTYNVQATFAQLLAVPGHTLPTNIATAAIVIVLPGAGGTTSPAPGTYAMDSATSFNLTAHPSSGWVFLHWVISGPNLSHGGYPFTATPTENPYNVNHGYGNTYSYQPVFIPAGVTEPTPTTPEFSAIATIAIALILVAIAFGTYAYRRKVK